MLKSSSKLIGGRGECLETGGECPVTIFTWLFFSCLAPPEFEAPTFYRVVSDAKLIVVLNSASPENGDITHYYVVVVPDELANERRPDDFKLDEVLILNKLCPIMKCGE